MKLRASAVLPFLLLACESGTPLLPALELESEHSIVGVAAELGGTLCRGDLAYIDEQIERTEERLDTRRAEPVTIHIVPLSIISEYCGPESGGCYSPGEDTIYARWHTTGHELVHAVARDLDFPSLFWSEGAAEALSGLTLRDDRITLSPADLEAESLTTYRSAGHFSRFLVETRGWAGYRRAIRSDPVQDVYGQSALDLTTEYEQDAPYSFPPLDPCPRPRIPQVDETHWRSLVEFSCESPGTTAFGGGFWGEGASVDLAIELTAGTYELELTGGEKLYAIACHTQVLQDETNPPSNGDLYNEVDLAAALGFESGKAHRLELAEGTYQLTVSSGTYGLASAELLITRIE